jgi:putative ABC transport system permease protein
MLNDLLLRLRSLFLRNHVEAEINEELHFHFEKQVAKLVESGLPAEEARRRARLEFGGMEQIKEEHRDSRGISFIETMLQDIRFGLRLLGRTPVITTVAILSLALGIGANTAIFSLIDTVMLRMLPVQKPEELMQVRMRDPRSTSDEPNPTFTNPLWEELRNRQDVFSGVFSWSSTRFNLARGGTAHYVNGIFASGEFFSTLGVRPASGRLIAAADDQRGCPAVADLSYGFWQDHFGGSPSAVGSTLTLDDHMFQVIGVSAPGFYGVDVGEKSDVVIPVCAAALFDGKRSRLDHRSWWWLTVIGRVKSGTNPDQVNARLEVLSPQISAAALPQNWKPKDQQDFLNRTFVLNPAATGISELRRKFKQPLNILMAIVGLVLLIACSNIASLMLSRAAARQKEIALRRALGASRPRLIRQMLTECVLLSSAGALLGILFARWGTALLVRYLSTARNTVFLDLSLDWRILTFTAAVAVFTGLLFGVVPAVRSTRVSLTSAMKGGQTVEGERRARFRPGKWIVASQVALSLVLIVAAGLFLRSLVKLATLDIGFDRNNVLLVSAKLNLPSVTPEQQSVMFEQVESRLQTLPGVVSAGRSVLTPMSRMVWNNILLVDSPNAPTGENAIAFFNFISPGYFETLHTPLLAGRNFNDHDIKTSPQVAIVNETLARKFFPNLNPLGKYFRVEPEPGQFAPLVQIVGITKDAKYQSLREDTFATAYFPITQVTEPIDADSFELRTAARPSLLIPAVQDAVAGVNKSIQLEFHTLAEQVDDSLVQERLLATLSGFFGGLALLLAMIGLYGALSYLVTLRRPEFGIRMALGAVPVSILRLVLKDVTVVLAGGVTAGAFLSFLTVRLLQKMLFGLSPYDLPTIVTAIGLLSTVALLAGYLPARRAMRVDPMVALRYE